MEESKLVTIEDVCKSGSSNVSQNKLENIEGIYPIYGASGLIKNVDFYHQENPYLSIVKDGSGYGRITKMPEKTSVIGTLQYLLPKDNILLDYLYYGMQSIDFKKYVSGAAIPHIYFKDYKKEPILLRPIEEQKTIVAKLDQAFAAIDQAKANIEKNIANAKELFQSKLNQIFSQKGEGWETNELINTTKFIDYRGRTPKKTESGVRLVTAKNVKIGYLNLEPQEFIAEDNYDSWMSRGIPNYGDIIFTTEAPLANVAQINLNEKLAFAQRIIVMQPNPAILYQDFLKYSLISKPIRDKILSKGTGATVQGIKSSLLKKIIIDYPKSLEIQQQIVTQLDQLQEQTNILVSKYQQKLANLEELKKSILEKAFKGELV